MLVQKTFSPFAGADQRFAPRPPAPLCPVLHAALLSAGRVAAAQSAGADRHRRVAAQRVGERKNPAGVISLMRPDLLEIRPLVSSSSSSRSSSSYLGSWSGYRRWAACPRPSPPRSFSPKLSEEMRYTHTNKHSLVLFAWKKGMTETMSRFCVCALLGCSHI